MIAGSANPSRQQSLISSAHVLQIILTALFLTTFSAHAETRTWDGSADTLWSTGANWSGNVAPTTGDAIEFPSGASRLSNYNDLVGKSFTTMAFTTGGYRIKGEPIAVESFVFASYSSGTDTVDLAINGAGTFYMNANGGTMVLRGANGFTGETFVAFGAILVAAHDSALGSTASRTTVNNGGTLGLQGGITIVGERLDLAGVGNGSGALRNLSGVNTVAGLVKVVAAATIGSIADTLKLTDEVSPQSSLAVTFTGDGVTNVSGVIQGNFSSVIKNGTGTLILGGNNTYTTATALNAGTIKLSAGSNVFSSGPLGDYQGRITVASGAVLDLNGYTLGASHFKLMTLNGTGLTGLPAGALTNSGGDAASLGSITIGTDATITATTSGTLTLGSIFENANTLTLDGASGSSGTISGNFNSSSGGLIKAGAGSWTLAGTATVGGALALNAGTLGGAEEQTLTVNGSWSATGNFAHNGGTVVLNGGSSQSINNATYSPFNNLTIDNAADVSLLSAVRVDGALTLANGKITTSSSVLSIGKTGSVANANATRFIDGNLRRYIPASTNASYTFPIGASASYRPVTIAFTGTTIDNGFVTATTTLDTAGAGASGLDSAADVRGSWTFADSALGSFTSYAATLNWPSADVNIGANTAAFLARHFLSDTWTSTSADSRTATSIRATGLTGFGTLRTGLPERPASLDYAFNAPTYIKANAIATNTPSLTGGNIGLAYAVQTGALPSGLTLNANGTITGTPSVIGVFTLTVRVSNVGGFAEDSLSITVVDVAPTAISYGVSQALYTLSEGITVNRAVVTGGSENLTFAVQAGILPNGISLNTSTGMLWGIPLSLGEFSFTIRVSNSGGYTEAILDASVRDVLPIISYPGDTVEYWMRSAIETVVPTNLGGVVRSWSIAPNLAAITGLAFNTTTGRISGTPVYLSAPTQYVITATGFGLNVDHDTLVISTITEAPTVSYNSEPQQFDIGTPVDFAKSDASGIILSYAVSPSLPAGLRLNTTTGRIVGIPTAVISSTEYVVTATGPGGTGSDTIYIAVTTPAPTVSYTDVLQSFEVGVPVDFAKSGASGRILSYAVSPSLPAGLLLNTTTGRIAGIPTAVISSTDYVVTATGPGGMGLDTVHIEVTTPAPTVSYANTPLIFPLGIEIATVSKSGVTGILSGYSISPALPVGLVLSTTTGRITGNPRTVTVTTDYVITVTGPGGTGKDTLSIEISSNPPNIAFVSDTVSFVTGAGITAFRPSNIGGPITGWSISLGSNGQSLTANTGLVFNPTTGKILGVPVYVTVARSYTVIANGIGGAADSAVIAIATTTPISKHGVGENEAFAFRVTGRAAGYNLRMPALDEKTRVVSVVIQDMSGRTIWSGSADAGAGIRELVWDGRDQAGRLVSAGMYMVRMAQMAD